MISLQRISPGNYIVKMAVTGLFVAIAFFFSIFILWHDNASGFDDASLAMVQFYFFWLIVHAIFISIYNIIASTTSGFVCEIVYQRPVKVIKNVDLSDDGNATPIVIQEKSSKDES